VLLPVFWNQRDTSLHRARRVMAYQTCPRNHDLARVNGIQTKNRAEDIGSSSPHEASKPNDLSSLYAKGNVSEAGLAG
jgi:hypothetical protein